MPNFIWRDNHSVNVEEIDTQHKKILELVNNLHTSVEARLDKNKLEEMLIDLVEYTRMHFATEEKYMKEHDYSDLNNHHNEHRTLLQHLEHLVAAVSNGKHPTFYSDYDISSDWAMVHIMEYDKKLGDFLNSKNIY